LVDDVYGWDFAGNNNSVFDGIGDDHGTHVAGAIGGAGGNGKGVAGVTWNVKMMNAKFL
jgi:subtilisin family serine protease